MGMYLWQLNAQIYSPGNAFDREFISINDDQLTSAVIHNLTLLESKERGVRKDVGYII